MTDLDDKDLAILRILGAEGRISFTELAERVSLSQTPVLKRVRRLEDQGYITGYRAILDPAKLGGKMTVFTRVSLVNQKRDSLIEFERLMLRAPEVMDCYLMSGDADYMLIIVVDSLAEFEAFLSVRLAALDQVDRIQSSFALRSVIRKSSPPGLALPLHG